MAQDALRRRPPERPPALSGRPGVHGAPERLHLEPERLPHLRLHPRGVHVVGPPPYSRGRSGRIQRARVRGPRGALPRDPLLHHGHAHLPGLHAAPREQLGAGLLHHVHDPQPHGVRLGGRLHLRARDEAGRRDCGQARAARDRPVLRGAHPRGHGAQARHRDLLPRAPPGGLPLLHAARAGVRAPAHDPPARGVKVHGAPAGHGRPAPGGHLRGLQGPLRIVAPGAAHRA
mmetsp:Transcript_10888/g.37005  ORF Transcript_10888/g.37005 Transcript_10888/m.37005 type:complete len:231 (-) Transcript_10888:1813-2505(-)